MIIFISTIVLYSLGIAGHEIYLFLAGLAGGATLTEVATSLERKEAGLERRYLREENKNLASQVLSIREPELAAAVEVGINFAMVDRSSHSNSADFLGVSDHIRNAADGNDTDAVWDALRIKFGTAVSESFMLGRQLALLLISEDVGSETRTLVGERLALRVHDDELVEAVDKVLARRKSSDDSEKARYQPYIGLLMKYLSGSTTTVEARNSRDRLVLGTSAPIETLDDGEEERRIKFKQLLERLIEAKVDKRDADVQLFWAVEIDDPKLLQEALDNGANISTTDKEIVRRYRDYL
jgi:hypothetical protein